MSFQKQTSTLVSLSYITNWWKLSRHKDNKHLQSNCLTRLRKLGKDLFPLIRRPITSHTSQAIASMFQVKSSTFKEKNMYFLLILYAKTGKWQQILCDYEGLSAAQGERPHQTQQHPYTVQSMWLCMCWRRKWNCRCTAVCYLTVPIQSVLHHFW